VLVRAVFFDVDDTLVDYATAASAALNRALGPDVDQAAWAALPHYERFSSGELGFEQMRVLRMVDYLAAHGRQDEAAEDLEQLRIDHLSERCESFSDVLSCLGELQQRGLVLGAITNNDGAHQRAKLIRVGIDPYLSALAISGELGFAKPDPRIFHHACAQLGVEPGEAIHVGDRLDLDARAAAAAGLRGVWLDRSGSSAAVEVPDGVAVIRGLDELAELLG
jgi:putative hydrolase of the HAD superfamily